MECDSGEVERERVGSEWGVKVWSVRVGGGGKSRECWGWGSVRRGMREWRV